MVQRGRDRPWSALLWGANFVSLLGSGCMVAGCLCLTCRLGGVRRTPLFVRQLLVLASADLLWAVWWFAQTGALTSLQRTSDPDNCTMYITGLRFLQMLSVLSTVHIAAGLLAALGRRERMLRLLARTQLAAVPCALACSSAFLVWPPVWNAACEYCMSKRPAELLFCGEVCLAFCTTAAIHVLATHRLVRGAPEEVAARSIQRAANYLAVFLLCWSVFVVGVFLGLARLTGGSLRLWHDLRDTLASASGGLNTAVYARHHWRLLRRYFRTRPQRWRRWRRRRRGASNAGDTSRGGSSAGSSSRLVDGSLGSTPRGLRTPGRSPRGILAGGAGGARRPGLAPPASRGVAFSPSVVDGEPACLLVTPRTSEVFTSAEAQIRDIESRRSWMILGADPLLLDEAQLFVQDAGCQRLNGLYHLFDCQHGRPIYRSAAGHTIRWSLEEEEWQMCLGGQHVVYWQEDDSLAPPVSDWTTLHQEELPVPTVLPVAWAGCGEPGSTCGLAERERWGGGACAGLGSDANTASTAPGPAGGSPRSPEPGSGAAGAGGSTAAATDAAGSEGRGSGCSDA